MTDRYFDDFQVGQRFTTPGSTLTESMMLDFAYRYDPQPFHMDVEAAKDTVYGGIIASGWLTLVHAFRLFITEGIFKACSMGSPGLDELRWHQPVRPGETLHVEAEVLELHPSRSKPDRGVLRMGYQVVNQRGENVLSFSISHMLRRRPQ